MVDGETRGRSPELNITELWLAHGEGELGAVYCLVDPAEMHAYDPNCRMVHVRKTPNSDPY
jgi:hypothetical protein